MTAQWNDNFLYNDVDFSISGISEGELFNPNILNLEPVGTCTACWRGYVAGFSLSHSILVLKTLEINLFRDVRDDCGYLQEKKGPVINGVKPNAAQQKFKLFNNYYCDLNYRIDYTGGLLLANDFIQDLYVHMGFHPAWKYKKVIELIFEDGVLIKELDHSEKMAKFRTQITDSFDRTSTSEPRTFLDTVSFVENAFDRTYKI